MAYETKGLQLSIATIVLTILAIIIFIYQRGSAAFYATAIIAIVVGFTNAWLLSRNAMAGQQTPVLPGSAKAGKIRARSIKRSKSKG